MIPLETRCWCEKQWRRLPFVDQHDGSVSITRTIALFFAWVVWQTISRSLNIPLNVLWFALAVMAMAFGKSTFTFLLTRMRFLGESKQADVHVTTEIIDRRNRDQGLEHTP